MLAVLTATSNAVALATTTTLAVSPPSPANAGIALTLTATVKDSNNALVTLGTVNFFDASATPKLIATAQLTLSGQATVKLRLSIGSHPLTSVFQATHANLGSSSTSQAIVLNPSSSYATATNLAVSGNAGNYTLTGTLTAFGFLTPTATTLSFIETANSNNVLGTGTLSSGVLGFAPHVDYANGNVPVGITSGDFNGDGNIDLAVTNYSSNQIAIYLGNGDGTFQAQVTYGVGTNPYSVAAGDFNGDGQLDLAVTNQGSNTVNVLIGNGDGTFQAAATYAVATNPVAVAVGDFNEDGKLDLAVSSFNTGNIALFIGNGDGTFQAATYRAAGSSPHRMAVADFNGDGHLDIAVSNNVLNTVSVMLGNGDGTFQPRVAYAVQASPIGVVAGDFRGVGTLDLAVANSGASSLSLLLGNGDGTFQSQVTYATGGGASDAVVGDFNGDGKLDLAVANFSASAVPLFFGNGDGTLQSALTYATGTGDSGYLTKGDFAGSGNPGLAVVAESDATVSVLRSAQTFTSTLSGVSVYGSSGHSAAAVYVPAPADPYASATSAGMPLTGLFLLFDTPPAASINAGRSPGTVIVSVNAGGSFLATSTAMVQLGVAGPNGYSRTYSVAAMAGLATFSSLASPTVAGAYTYTSGFPAGGNAGQAAMTETVLVGAANKLVITGPYPSAVNAGSENALTVTVEDAAGNGVTNYSGAVSLSSSTDSLATLNPPSHTYTVADAGVHSFQGTFHTSGVQSLTASAGGLTSATQGGIVVNDFTMTATPPSRIIAQGQSATYSLSVLPFTSSATRVALSCSGLPAGAMCAFTPLEVSLSGGAATSKLVITTASRLARMFPIWPHDLYGRRVQANSTELAGAKLLSWMWIAVVFGVAGLIRPRQRRFAGSFLLLVVACFAFVSGCNGGFPLVSKQAAASYTVTISGSATGGTLQHSTTVILNVH
jgi:hypothetical protein